MISNYTIIIKFLSLLSRERLCTGEGVEDAASVHKLAIQSCAKYTNYVS